MKRTGRSLALFALAGLALGGCYRRYDLLDPPNLDGGTPSIPDAFVPLPDASTVFVEPTAKCVVPSAVDLLLVIDNSASMTEEQASLVAEIPRLVTLLAEPPDEDGDGELDWLAVESLHVGVVTTDMGTGGHSVPTCDTGAFGSAFGDDGILRTRAALRPGCSATYPAIFELGAGTDRAQFAMDVSCVASVGTGGCGFEQPLEAMLKALSPQRPTSYTATDYEPPTFFDSTLGHGDVENAGFLRDESLLAVVIVTDEEDCSARDPGVFDPISMTYGGVDLNLRCFTFPSTSHTIERYFDGFRALRARRPDLLALAVIAGVPPETTAPSPTLADYEAMLAHPDMQERIDPEMPTRLVPSCNVPGRGIAFPPRRLVRTALALGTARSTVQSICQEDFAPAVLPVVRLIGRRACQARMID